MSTAHMIIPRTHRLRDMQSASAAARYTRGFAPELSVLTRYAPRLASETPKFDRDATKLAVNTEKPTTDAPKLVSTDVGNLDSDVGELDADVGELGTDVGELGSDVGELDADVGELPVHLRRRIDALGVRPRREKLWPVLLTLCEYGAWQPTTLARLLGRSNVRRFVDNHLTPLVADGLLERTHPDNPTHPGQAYRTTEKGRASRGPLFDAIEDDAP